MAFSFGFSGDDIEEDPNDMQEQSGQQTGAAESNVPPPIPAQTHDLDEMVGFQSSSIYICKSIPYTKLS
jgi:protein-histidine N-methyltransferase